MKRLKIAEGFSLPAEAAADAIAIVGRRGRGKTTTAVVLVEELHAAGERFAVADPVGVWWGLKSSRDGKGAGYKSSGDVSSMFSRLNAAGYAVKVGPGQLRAADELFEE